MVTRSRAQPEDFVARLTDACVAWKAREGIADHGKHREREYPHILPPDEEERAVWPSLRPMLGMQLPPRLRHSGFGNLKSSQTFAVNVLGGLDHAGLLALALERRLGRPQGSFEVERVRFEYAPAVMRDVLGEKGRHSTQIDAVVWLREGARRIALVTEVKLTESAFGGCRGPAAKDNPPTRREVCTGHGDRRLSDCYLRHGEHQRRYLHHASAYARLGAALGDGGCPLRADGYQIARNLIVTAWLAGGLAPDEAPPPAGDGVDEAVFMVLSAAETPALHGQVLAALGPGPSVRLAALGARWIDAAKLVASVAAEPRARALTDWLALRYPPVFAP